MKTCQQKLIIHVQHIHCVLQRIITSQVVLCTTFSFLKTLLELKESRRSKKLTKFEMLRFEVVDYIDSVVR